MTAAQFNKALRALGLNQSQARRYLFRTLRSINGYANGQEIPPEVEMLLRLYLAHGLQEPAE